MVYTIRTVMVLRGKKQSLKLVYQQPTPNEIRLSFQCTLEGILRPKGRRGKGMLEMWRSEVVDRWPNCCDQAQVTFIDPCKGRLSPCYCRGHSLISPHWPFFCVTTGKGVEQSTSIFMRSKIIQMAGREKTYGLFYLSP